VARFPEIHSASALLSALSGAQSISVLSRDSSKTIAGEQRWHVSSGSARFTTERALDRTPSNILAYMVDSPRETLMLQVPIVVTAEDGVTSLRYYVVVTRATAVAPAPAPAPAVPVISADSLGPVSELYSVPLRTGTSDGRLGAFGAIAPSSSSSSSSSGDIRGGGTPVAAPLGGQLSFSFTPSSEQVRRPGTGGLG